MNGILIELLVSLTAASVFGVVIGWLLKGSSLRQQQKLVDARWQQQFAELELRTRQDNEHLQARVQSLGRETVDLKAANRALEAALQQIGDYDELPAPVGRDISTRHSMDSAAALPAKAGSAHAARRRSDCAMPWLYTPRGKAQPRDLRHGLDKGVRDAKSIPAFEADFGGDNDGQDTLVIDPDDLQLAALDETLRLQDLNSCDWREHAAGERSPDIGGRPSQTPPFVSRLAHREVLDASIDDDSDDTVVVDDDAVLLTDGDSEASEALSSRRSPRLPRR